MSTTGVWVAVLATSVGCYLVKLAGLVLPARALRRPAIRRFVTLAPLALLAALIALQTFTSGGHLTVDARAGGLLAGVVALLLKAPFLVVVVVAIVATALLRLAF